MYIAQLNKLKKEEKKILIKNLSIKRLCKNCEFNQKTQSLKENYCIRIKIPNEGKILIMILIQGKVIVEK